MFEDMKSLISFAKAYNFLSEAERRSLDKLVAANFQQTDARPVLSATSKLMKSVAESSHAFKTIAAMLDNVNT